LLAEEPKCARSRELALKRRGGYDVGPVLSADHWMREVDGDLEAKLGGRRGLVDRFPVDHSHGIGQLQIVGRLMPVRQSGAVQRIEKRRGASVEDRRLGAV